VLIVFGILVRTIVTVADKKIKKEIPYFKFQGNFCILKYFVPRTKKILSIARKVKAAEFFKKS
jgi:hypothetical protein